MGMCIDRLWDKYIYFLLISFALGVVVGKVS